VPNGTALLSNTFGSQHSIIARESNQECMAVQLVNETRPQIRRDRFLRLPEVEAITGLRKSTLYLLMSRGEFPRSVQITPRCVAWPESRVLQYVQDKIAGADQLPLIGAKGSS
jgi:prophage regulatory protein